MESRLLIWIFLLTYSNINTQVQDDTFHSNPLKSCVFDSYLKLTNLENYPNVCEEYSNENCAHSWLIEINEIMIRNSNRMENVNFNLATNLNKVNSNLSKKYQVENEKLLKLLRIKAMKFNWKSFQSFEIRRLFVNIVSSIQNQHESDSKKLVDITDQISFIYNNGKPCFGTCLPPGEPPIINVFHDEHDYDTLTGFWVAWRNVTGAKIKNLFIEKVDLENKGARENGYDDAASFHLFSDFEENDFKDTVMKLYSDILPLYKELHAYVRNCLSKYYPGRFDKDGPIPAHILGNVWAQQWNNIFPIIKQCMGNKQTSNFQKEVDKNLGKISVKKMFQMSEIFFKSIGLDNMTDEFWGRSVMVNPADRVVDCHGSAIDFSNGCDYRILMCAKKNIEDFQTIHHEMGHIQYFMAYRNLPILFRNSANPGFHEAIGDTIALAVKTPEHLQKIGLIKNIPSSDDFDIDYLMITALEKVVFLPFALTMDSFIWGVYNGSVPVTQLNKYWWELRYRFQGLKPPIGRTEEDFDAGSKYHIAFGISYIRYFVSFVVQFQFYESMCKISGHEGALHRCDFYQSKEAGSRLLEMMKKGKSKPWRETMEILTGTNEIKAGSFLEFFDPLFKWLKDENEKSGVHVGW